MHRNPFRDLRRERTSKNFIRQTYRHGNPFKFGMIGSTDAHTSLATTREDNFFGKNPPAEPDPCRWSHVFMKSELEGTDYYNWETLASGLTGVWARENTREALFDAINRKEVYATTGSRITVRVFGGWDFNVDEVERPDFAERGYAAGVPMGGDLTNATAGEAPTFMVRALRDPDTNQAFHDTNRIAISLDLGHYLALHIQHVRGDNFCASRLFCHSGWFEQFGPGGLWNVSLVNR